MPYMFSRSKFNRDLSKWNPSRVTSNKNLFTDSPLEDNTPSWYEEY
jgi:hypothetical protein